jgi:hypothetical protein
VTTAPNPPAEVDLLTLRGPGGVRRAATTRPEGPERWYVAAQYVVTGVGEAAVARSRPTSTAHAKRPGTLTTACGLAAVSWSKLYDVAFPTMTGLDCRDCWQYVVGAG